MLNSVQHEIEYDAFELAFIFVSFVLGAVFFLDTFTGTNGFSMSYLIVAVYAVVSSDALSYIKGILAASVLGFICGLLVTFFVFITAVFAFFAN